MKILPLAAIITATALLIAPAHARKGSEPEVRVLTTDTLRIGTERVVIDGMIAPQHGSAARCEAERALATRTLHRLRTLIAHGPVSIERAGTQNGTTLARVTLGGRDIAGMLISAGLAATPDASSSWCR